MNIRKLTTGAIIAAVYAAVSFILAPISFGALQCRISEALTLLSLIMPEAIPGLFVGCLISNLLSGAVWYDVVFGSLATLLAAFLTYKSKNVWLGATYPVIVNAVVVGGYLSFFYNLPVLLTMLSVGAGQAIACYALGVPLVIIIKKHFETVK